MTTFGSIGIVTGAMLEKQSGAKNGNKNICMRTFYNMIIMINMIKHKLIFE